jgi:hypothetical protein
VGLAKARWFTTLGSGLLLAAAANAATSAKDVAVLSRVLGFVEPPLGGVVPIVIFYEQGDAASESDAKLIQATLASGGVKGATLKIRLSPSSDTTAVSGTKIVFIAAGTNNQAAIFSAAAGQGAVTVSGDMNCVRAGHCVVGVRSSPKVEIVVNRGASGASRVRFSKAFLMLVTEQ